MPNLVLQGGAGWLLEDDRTVIGGARLVDGRWLPWHPPCMQVNGPAGLAASTAQDVIAVCFQGIWGPASPAGVRAYISTDGGNSFHLLSAPLPSSAGGQGRLASPSPGTAFLAGGAGLLATFNGGATWSTVYQPPEGSWLDYVGFETVTQGVAISIDDSGATPVGSLLMTLDGGHRWSLVTL
ncbi:MAG: WD40/YVTN/BNR-like repeat-containing protein [Candidatus Dormibacteria bacterium]